MPMYSFTDELVDNYNGGYNDIFNTKTSSLQHSQKTSRIHSRHIMVKRSPGKRAREETAEGEKRVRFKTLSPSPPPFDPVPSAPPLPSLSPGSSLFDNAFPPLDLGPPASSDSAFGISSGFSAADTPKHSSPPNRSPHLHSDKGTKGGPVMPLLGYSSFDTASKAPEEGKPKEPKPRRILTPKPATRRKGKFSMVPRPGSDDESLHTTISGDKEGAREKRLTSKSTPGSDDPDSSSLFAPPFDRKPPPLRGQKKVIQRLTYFKVLRPPLLFPPSTLQAHYDAYSRPPKRLLLVMQILVGVPKQHQS